MIIFVNLSCQCDRNRMDEESDKTVKVKHFERFNIKFRDYLVNKKIEALL
jgi:hypothetical protein